MIFLLFSFFINAFAEVTPIQLFSCKTEPIPGFEVEISFINRNGIYQLIEGANLSHGNAVNIPKPVFASQKGKCLYEFKSRNKPVYVNRNTGEFFDDANKILGKCTFKSGANTCDEDKTTENVKATKPASSSSLKN